MLFSVVPRTVVEEALPLCKGSVGISFCQFRFHVVIYAFVYFDDYFNSSMLEKEKE